MNATILSIGDELLIGQVVNTNASWLGDRLTSAGVIVRRILAIGDGRSEIAHEIEAAAATSDLVIVSGGLGPTHDDLTRDAICDLLDCDLQMNDEQLRRIEERFKDRINERSRRQALVPSACDVIPNNFGSAPGLSFARGRGRVYVLPGVPSEMKGIFEEFILPDLLKQAGEIERSTMLMFGVTESHLADALTGTVGLLDEKVTLAYLPSPGGIRLRAMRRGSDADAADRYRRLLEMIRTDATSWLVSDRDETLAAATGRLLKERGLMLATAESCTGGLIGEMLTANPGSSEYYLGGIISYDNSVKIDQLGVDAEVLAKHGAVSGEVAEAMARGVRRRLKADIAISLTGIAGPGGGSTEKPVGTVWIGLDSERGTFSRAYQLGKERDSIRARAANTAIDMVRREALLFERG